LTADLEPHLTERELAARWRTSVRTVQRKRRKGDVPPHFFVARRVLYPLPGVVAYEAAHLRNREGEA